VSYGETKQTANWQEEVVYNDGDLFFSAFETAVQNATHSIYVETYIFDLDPLGLKLLGLFQDAVKRGVKVKILLDGIGSSSWTHEIANRYREHGLEIQFFHPLLWQRPSFIFKFPNFRLMNHRDHRKLYLVDGTHAFVGSMNISARHLRSLSGDKCWRDTSVILTGDPVSTLQDSFWVSWTTASEHAWTPRRLLRRFFSKLKMPILLKHTLRQRRIYREMVISRINNTHRAIWITTPYFVPDRYVLRAILDASRRGIDVRLLFPKVSDFFAVKSAMEGYYTKLLSAGVKIHEYLPSMLHAKIMMLDDFITLGSSNLNHRSFFKDLEVDVVLGQPATKALLREEFLQDLKSTEQRELTQWRKRSFFRKCLERFFYLFRGIL
jgi:cardiolipin synthase